MILISILFLMAYVRYVDAYFLSESWIVFPWCNANSYSFELHNYSMFVNSTSQIWLAGVIWVLLGLILIPVVRTSFKEFRWRTAIIGCGLVLLLQILIVTYGYTLASAPDVFTTVFPLPVSPLLSLMAIIFYYRKTSHETRNAMK